MICRCGATGSAAVLYSEGYGFDSCHRLQKHIPPKAQERLSEAFLLFYDKLVARQEKRPFMGLYVAVQQSYVVDTGAELCYYSGMLKKIGC